MNWIRILLLVLISIGSLSLYYNLRIRRYVDQFSIKVYNKPIPLSTNVTTNNIKKADEKVLPLVLLATEDLFTPHIKQKLLYFKEVSDVYNSVYNIQSLFFTKSPEIVNLFKNSSVIISDAFLVNKFNIPIVTSLFKTASTLFKAKYYGYINSDIIIENNTIEILQFCENEVANGRLYPIHEIAGRVYQDREYKFPSNLSTLQSISSLYSHFDFSSFLLRNKLSADYFFFPAAALPSVTNTSQPIVVARTSVDNYLMGAIKNYDSKAKLIDATFILRGIHIGANGVKRRSRIDHSEEDCNWNVELMKRHNLSYNGVKYKGTLQLRRKNNMYNLVSKPNSYFSVF